MTKAKFVADHLTKVAAFPSKSDAVAGMAYFRGTGPFGETCGKCRFFSGKAVKGKKRCEKHQALAKREGQYIEPGNAACKYFVVSAARHDSSNPPPPCRRIPA